MRPPNTLPATLSLPLRLLLAHPARAYLPGGVPTCLLKAVLKVLAEL